MSRAPRPRVLFVGAFPPSGSKVFGGMVTSCRALLQSSLPQRVILDLLDTTQISHPPPGFVTRLLLAVRRFAKFLRQFGRERPDVLMLFVAVGPSVVEKCAMAWYARMRGVPTLLFPRGGGVIDACRDSPVTRAWVALAFRGARRVLCQGPAWRTFVIETLGFRPEDAPVVTNWTATPDLLAIGRARASPVGGKPVKLLFLGWLEREKGVLDLIEACAGLPRDRFVLELAGEGGADAAARAQVVQHGLQHQVRFLGWLQGDELTKVLTEADILVLPSWVEGLPNAMIEAMAARLAVVVTAVGNVPKLVADEREALLVQPRDVPGLRNSIARLIDDVALRAKVADAGHDLAKRSFGVDGAVDAIVEQVVAVAGSERG